MTAPGMGSGSELPRDVHTAAQLGNILQSLNATKLKAASSGRLPDVVTDTPGGLVGGPMRIITDLFGQFLGGIANDAPGSPTLSTADDLPDLVTQFFGDLPVNIALSAFQPLAHLLAWLTGTDVDDWDDPDELALKLPLAIMRVPLKLLLDIIGDIPVVGDDIEGALAGWLKQTEITASGATQSAEEIRNGIVNGWAAASTVAANMSVYDTMQAIFSATNNAGYTKVDITSTQTWTLPENTVECILVGIAAGQNGQTAPGMAGGAGGLGGGHSALSINTTGLTAIHVTIGTNGASTVFRAEDSGGDIILEVITAVDGGMATQFGYTGSGSTAGGGGGGGGRGGTGGLGVGGGQNGGSGTGLGAAGGIGGSSAVAIGGVGGDDGTGGTGGAAPAAGLPCGGGGGGGGGAPAINFVAGKAGGAGGYPGGGGGGGSGAAYAAGGVGGAGGAGKGYIYYRQAGDEE